LTYRIVFTAQGYRLAPPSGEPIGPALADRSDAEAFRAHLAGAEPTQAAMDVWKATLTAARDARAAFASEHGLEVCEEHGDPIYFRPSECDRSEGNCPWCWSVESDEIASYGRAEASKSLHTAQRQVEAQAARVPDLEHDLRATKERAERRELDLNSRIRELERRVEELRRTR